MIRQPQIGMMKKNLSTLNIGITYWCFRPGPTTPGGPWPPPLVCLSLKLYIVCQTFWEKLCQKNRRPCRHESFVSNRWHLPQQYTSPGEFGLLSKTALILLRVRKESLAPLELPPLLVMSFLWRVRKSAPSPSLVKSSTTPKAEAWSSAMVKSGSPCQSSLE